ncbi:MAG: amidohydrolase family protein [Clostridia bacterium]|nr:amidohydrolase family protein [Clostridia bacterium]
MASVFQSIIAAITAFIIGIFPFLDFEIKNEREKLMDGNVTIKCAAFDGNEFHNSATLVLDNGVIVNDVVFGNEETDSEYYLLPALIDAHTHISSEKEIKNMIKNGVLTTCDAAAGTDLVSASETLDIHTSLTTVMPGLSDGRARVEELISQGADYIKVMVDMPAIMGGGLIDSAVLKDMVDCAHENGLKVAAHVTTVAAVQLAVDTGADILIHVPIGEEFPETLAQQIAEKDIAVVPTLVMMQAFAKSPFYGYKRSDYKDAENAVRLLDSYGVTILAGTDSNSTFYVPKIKHGTSLHDEMELLVKAGMKPADVMKAATSDVAKVFGLENAGTIEEGKKSVMILVKGNPCEEITDSTKIVQIWVDGQPVL